jgi:hypothetical protein
MSSAAAKARAADSLDEAARALKRTIATCRTTLQIVRQTQAEVVGIEIETLPAQHPEVQSDHAPSSNTR